MKRKPCPPKNATAGVRTFPDGRELCLNTAEGSREYRSRLGLMCVRQLWRCAICKASLTDPQFDHEAGRGSGGARRDDRIVIDGRRHNAALCEGCNSTKGSVRYAWNDDNQYLPIGKRTA